MAEDIDTAMTAGPGLRYGLLGPLRTADLGGLDVFHAISGYLFAELIAAPGPRPCWHSSWPKGSWAPSPAAGSTSMKAGTWAKLLPSETVWSAFLKILAKEKGG